MDANRFDRLSRTLSPLISRRTTLFGAGLVGVGAIGVDAKKRRRNRNGCKGGCAPCHVCKKNKTGRTCVPVVDGSTCPDGVCQAGACTCPPQTCSDLGNVCGPQPDGCGEMLTCDCGDTATPACIGGTCSTCAAACGGSCVRCFYGVDGSTTCSGVGLQTGCIPCSRDADCPANRPLCATGTTFKPSNQYFSYRNKCDVRSAGICVNPPPC